MSYFLKWIPESRSEVMQTGVAYARPEDAMDFACVILKQAPDDIWVEDGHGTTIVRTPEITQHCRMRGRAD